MKELDCTIIQKENLTHDVFRLVLSHNDMPEFKPGQFIELRVPGKCLRRPISINAQDGQKITLVIKEVGEGTKILHQMKEGEKCSVIMPLGNGFDLSPFQEEVCLIGGGIGVAPLLYTAVKAKERGLKVITVLGFRNEEETILKDEFTLVSDELYIAYDSRHENVLTMMQSHSIDTDALVCGPMGMMKALALNTGNRYQFSLETRMGCGFGACMGCSIETRHGMARICKEGPVFKGEDILWL